ncbi:MAG: SEC-C domain-containing protein [Tatlockia sp.]|nr:SEC-C domain-containing protein [Tatlockia sp.]
MSKTGRNDPCPCDSGKKYKKCCSQIHIEEALLSNKQREYNSEEKSNQYSLSDKLLGFDSYQEPQNFDEAIKALEILLESDKPDAEDLLDAFGDLFSLGENKPHFEHYLSMIEVLKDKHPIAYRENQKYFLLESIQSLLILGQYMTINGLLSTYIKCAEDDIDIISRTTTLLVFYGLDEAALTLYRLAWPAINRSDNIFPWAKDSFKTDYYRLLTIQELVGNLSGATIFDAEKFLLIDKQQEEDRSIYTDMRKKLLESSNFDAAGLKKNGELLKEPAVYHSVMNAFIRFLMKKNPNNICKTYAYWNAMVLYLNFLFDNQTSKSEKKQKNWNILYPRKKIVEQFIQHHYLNILLQFDVPYIVMFLESLYYWILFLLETHILEDVDIVFDSISRIYQIFYDDLKSTISQPLYQDRVQKFRDTWSDLFTTV